MKHFYTLLLCLFSLTSQSQLLVGIGAGYSKSPTVQLEVGVMTEHINVSTELISHVSSNIDHPALFHLKVGYIFEIKPDWYLNPNVGFGYTLYSNDKTQMNRETWTAGLELLYDTGEVVPFLSVQAAYKNIFPTVGIKLGLLKDKYCN